MEKCTKHVFLLTRVSKENGSNLPLKKKKKLIFLPKVTSLVLGKSKTKCGGGGVEAKYTSKTSKNQPVFSVNCVQSK